jgi:hypothetical protein
MPMNPMSTRFAAIANVLLLLWLSSLISAFSQAPTSTASPSRSSISPDKRWEYRCEPYADHTECVPKIVRVGTTEVVLDLQQELTVSGSESVDARIFWTPDSKRFAFNYSPIHAHHTTYETVAFYQVNGDRWVRLASPVEETEHSQLVELAKKHLLKGFKPRTCATERDVLKLRSWADPNTAILYGPCYGRTSGELEAGFLFTLKFDDAGNWKIVKTHQMSKKEIEKEAREQ